MRPRRSAGRRGGPRRGAERGVAQPVSLVARRGLLAALERIGLGGGPSGRRGLGRRQKALRRHYGRALAESQGEAEYKRLRDLHARACTHASVVAGLAFLSGEEGFSHPAGAVGRRSLGAQLRRRHSRPAHPDAAPARPRRALHEDHALELRRDALARAPGSATCSAACPVPRFAARCSATWAARWSPPTSRRSCRSGMAAAQTASRRPSAPCCGGVGSYAKKAVNNLLHGQKSERHPTEIAHLAGSRLVFCEEIQDGKHLAEALVKDLTGGAPKTARFMHKDFFWFEQTFSLFLLVNHRPVISGTDRGIWRRIRLVPWTVSHPARAATATGRAGRRASRRRLLDAALDGCRPRRLAGRSPLDRRGGRGRDRRLPRRAGPARRAFLPMPARRSPSPRSRRLSCTPPTPAGVSAPARRR